ncbi:MAG: class I SAM-dependent methyltransferase [Vagococcus sp.]
MLQPALRYSHILLQECINPGDIVVDATMGNGHDTVFLSQLVGPTGVVYGFDVQEQALHATQLALANAKQDATVHLFLQGHETLGSVITEDTPIKAGVFNLGYLPKSDKSIATTGHTTIQAIDALLMRLQAKGRIILVIYDGHDEGKDEKKHVLNYVTHLPQDTYNVIHYHFINQQNNPPSLVCIEQKKQTQRS